MLASQVKCPHCSHRLQANGPARPRCCPHCGAVLAAKPRPNVILQSKPYAPPPVVIRRSRKGLWAIVATLAALLLLAVGLVIHEAAGKIDVTPSTGIVEIDPPPDAPSGPPARPLTAEEQRISEAIDRGVAYLRSKQRKDGTFSDGHALGLAALPGLTLLECGVPATDPQVERAAAYVRLHAPRNTATYELALAVLFLDRLGEPQDRGLIRSLALRLIAGQTVAGGWYYDCPLLNSEEENALDSALRRLPRLEWSEEALGGKKPVAPAPSKTQPLELPGKLRDLSVVQNVPGDQPAPGHDAPSDNSNTQFAILGIWAARRHGVPVDRSLALIERRFRVSQNKQEGGWGYNYSAGGHGRSSPAMSCAGLLGLAVGYGRTEQDADKPAARHVEDDAAIRKGLAYLSQHIDKPLPKPPRNVGALPIYFLWSVERVGMMYGLTEIGDRDWYAWGSQLLLAAQHRDGHWQGDNHSGDAPCSTSLALLFLKRVNLVWDLPTKFRNPDPGPG